VTGLSCGPKPRRDGQADGIGPLLRIHASQLVGWADRGLGIPRQVELRGRPDSVVRERGDGQMVWSWVAW